MVPQHSALPPPQGQQGPPIRPPLPQHSWTGQNHPYPLPGTWPSHQIPLTLDRGPQQHSLLSAEERDLGELPVSENSTSVGKKGKIKENATTEEEDPTNSVSVGDTCDGRS